MESFQFYQASETNRRIHSLTYCDADADADTDEIKKRLLYQFDWYISETE